MRVRISIGNLAPVVLVPRGSSVDHFPMAILNSGSFKKGKRLFQPIGGAATLTEAGRQYLIDRFGASEFHKQDARFIVDDEHLDAIFGFFQDRDPEMFEIDPLREIVEELSTSEFPANDSFAAIPAPLTAEEAAQIKVEFVRTAIQPFKDDAGTSPLAGQEPSRRMFHLFHLVLPNSDMLKKLRLSPAIFGLNSEEANSTMGGSRKGWTDNGDVLADNFILP